MQINTKLVKKGNFKVHKGGFKCNDLTFNCFRVGFHCRSPEVLAETSEDVNCDQSTIYAKPIGTPPGSALNVSAPTFVPRHGSSFSITSLPPPVTTSGGWGPFNS